MSLVRNLLTGVIAELYFAAGPSANALDDLKWISQSADPVKVLTRAPVECLAQAGDADQAYLVDVGRVAFRTPLLLGGIAARSGVSCDTCHQNGHGNPDFFLKGVSGQPGTADVTGAVFSKSRDDGIDNPVVIPTLVDAEAPFGTVAPADTLDGFLSSAIVDEFQGHPPPAAVLAGLKAYLGDLNSSACPAGLVRPLSLSTDLDRVEQAMDVMDRALDRNDFEVADLAILGAQNALRRIHDRFTEFPSSQFGIVGLSRFLGKARDDLAIEPKAARQALSRARTMLFTLAISLKAHEAESLYDADAVWVYLKRN